MLTYTGENTRLKVSYIVPVQEGDTYFGRGGEGKTGVDVTGVEGTKEDGMVSYSRGEDTEVKSGDRITSNVCIMHVRTLDTGRVKV